MQEVSILRLLSNTDELRKLKISMKLSHDKCKVHTNFEFKRSKFKVTRPIDAVFSV